ncbi:MAG TPA: prenyltransferase/squalene oxidase repeat-containing protein [Pirellulales bacterium]|jgi:squalene-hopene/tetraprenyl-beta-curcumene cyclase|nr:prenyltransferase/squalene oxidase repeat-containing protein [Pirellulales bacterium]
MTMVDCDRLTAAYQRARTELLDAAAPHGHWVGELSSSALSTATAISALSLVARHAQRRGDTPWASPDGRKQLNELILAGMRWLCTAVNADGGWGDTDKSLSNIATTMLVRAAFHLTAVPAKYADLLSRAGEYTQSHGEIDGLRRRYGKDKTFAVPILANCALAGIVSWREVSALPFELACVPQKFYKFLKLPVVSYAIPALVAIGQARFYHRPPANPVLRWIRRRSIAKSLAVLAKTQPDSGGYLEATPLTSFVVMSMASMDLVEHPVTRRGVEFLIRSIRPDGSWPIDTNLATWNTTLALNALGAERTAGLDRVPATLSPSGPPSAAPLGAANPPPPVAGGANLPPLGTCEPAWLQNCLRWVAACQYQVEHPFTGAEPGGWGWSDLSGAVPDVDDTSGALLALTAWRRAAGATARAPSAEIVSEQSLRAGARWLLQLQNSDGGWPTFCRGWGTMPFDRSSPDLTAHAMRALQAWRSGLASGAAEPKDLHSCEAQTPAAIDRGFHYLRKQQRADGSWVPLWFGNQYEPGEQNPIYGTSRVLLAYRDLGQGRASEAERGAGWLIQNQNADGGWGGGPVPRGEAAGRGGGKPLQPGGVASSVEETAWALESLLAPAVSAAAQASIEKGLAWLVEAVEAGRHRECAPVGFYFAKLWYYERLYPLTFTVAALGQAVQRLRYLTPTTLTPAHLT